MASLRQCGPAGTQENEHAERTLRSISTVFQLNSQGEGAGSPAQCSGLDQGKLSPPGSPLPACVPRSDTHSPEH